MHSLPEALLERLKNRQAVLVTGLRCCELAGLPAWPTLCERLAERIADDGDKKAVLDLLHGGQSLGALALVRVLLPEEALLEVLQDAYPMTTPVPPTIQAAAGAPWRGFISTALDGLWASALAGDSELENRMVFASNAAGLDSGRGRFLLQLFGRTDVPASLCLAPFELAAKVVATGAARYLENLHKKWSFVFVGFAPDDPDLAMLAGRLLGASPSTVEHFFIAPNVSALDVRRMKAEFGLVAVDGEGSLQETLELLTQSCTSASDKPAADDVEAWIERLTADPHDPDADGMLEKGVAQLRERAEWERLVSALVSRAELRHEPRTQATDLHAAGLLLDKELAAPERAYDVLLMALHLTPYSAALLADVHRVAEKAGKVEEFIAELHSLEKNALASTEAGQLASAVFLPTIRRARKRRCPPSRRCSSASPTKARPWKVWTPSGARPSAGTPCARFTKKPWRPIQATRGLEQSWKRSTSAPTNRRS